MISIVKAYKSVRLQGCQGPLGPSIGRASLAIAVAALSAQAWSNAPAAPSPWTAPASAAFTSNPVSATTQSITRGRKLFARDCISCHGESGRGDGVMAALIDRRPGDLTAPRMAQQSDGELFWKISNGRSPMPTFEDFLTPTERWHLINYVRTLGPAPVAMAAARGAENSSPDPAAPANPAPSNGQDAPVSRREYESLLRQMQEMRREMELLRAGQVGAPTSKHSGENSAAVSNGSSNPPSTRESTAPISPRSAGSMQTSSSASADSEVARSVLDDARSRGPFSLGSTKFMISGFGFAQFEDRQGQPSTFSAGLSPVFLWEVTPRVLFESELELTLSESSGTASDHDHSGSETEGGDEGHGDSTNLELTYAHLSYILNDYVTVGAGKFLVPLGVFNERLHPLWVNKLPVAPLAFDHHGGLAPHNDVGAYVRGGMPIRDMRVNYVAYISNGPTAITEGESAGQIDFNNYPDSNNSKAVGGRFGFLPVPELELGYSLQYSGVETSGAPEGELLLQALDLVYQPQVTVLQGSLEFRAEWIWSRLDMEGSGGGPPPGEPILLRYRRSAGHDHGGTPGLSGLRRDGGYLQGSYRPLLAGNAALRSIEVVGRYDSLELPSGTRDRRWTLGLNYWLTPSMVLKGAYQLSEGETGDALFFQAVLGF